MIVVNITAGIDHHHQHHHMGVLDFLFHGDGASRIFSA